MNNLEGYERLHHGIRGWTLYRKIVNGKGKWKAEKDGVIKDITYNQALGYEPIDDAEKLGRWLGEKLGLKSY